MHIRPAFTADIPQIQEVRHSVKENTLSDPSLVTDADCEDYLNRRGRGWVAEEEGRIHAFAIVDFQDHNVWALFVRPEWEGRGIGSQLHDLMLKEYFSQTDVTIWLSTAVGTRAEQFYRLKGWQEAGPYGKNELKFVMEKAGLR